LSEARATRREFILYWVGVLVVASGVVAVLFTISNVIVDVLQSDCWYPIVSPLLGIPKPPETMIPAYYCSSPVVALVRFTFKLLAALVFIGVGVFMMMNGRRR